MKMTVRIFRALIVDDSPLMRNAMRKILEQNSCIVTIDEACNGLEALELIKQKEYHIILLDIEMPGMNGIEFMKRSKIYTDAPVVIVSSLAGMDSLEVKKALHFGASSVVGKPAGQNKPNELLDIVSGILSTAAIEV